MRKVSTSDARVIGCVRSGRRAVFPSLYKRRAVPRREELHAWDEAVSAMVPDHPVPIPHLQQQVSSTSAFSAHSLPFSQCIVICDAFFLLYALPEPGLRQSDVTTVKPLYVF